MKEMTCCFTGHRQTPSEYLPAISKKLRDTLNFYIGQGYRYLGAGGALGFDTLAAQIVLELKQQYPDIKLVLVLPCKDQASHCIVQDKEAYEQIKARADKIVYTSERYFNGCMQKRNRHLLEHSSLCICYLNKTTGETAYTVDYAMKKDLKIFNCCQDRVFVSSKP